MGNEKAKHDLYIRLLMSNQSKIYTFVRMLVPVDQDAEDLMQETASTLWEKFDSFRPGSDFASWAVTIARYKIMNYRRSKKNSVIRFSSQTLEAIETYANAELKKESPVEDYLRECLQRLSFQDRSLVQMRYAQPITIKAMAERLGRSPDGLHSSLSRIHMLLMACIGRKQIAEERL